MIEPCPVLRGQRDHWQSSIVAADEAPADKRDFRLTADRLLPASPHTTSRHLGIEFHCEKETLPKNPSPYPSRACRQPAAIFCPSWLPPSPLSYGPFGLRVLEGPGVAQLAACLGPAKPATRKCREVRTVPLVATTPLTFPISPSRLFPFPTINSKNPVSPSKAGKVVRWRTLGSAGPLPSLLLDVEEKQGARSNRDHSPDCDADGNRDDSAVVLIGHIRGRGRCRVRGCA